MPHLVYPTLDVFRYDLGDSLGLAGDASLTQRQQFASQLPASIASQLDFNQTGDYVELLGKPRVYQFTEADYEGYYYPVKMGDSYGLLLDASRKNPPAGEDWQWVTELKQFVEQQLRGGPPELGQTWVFYASVPEATLADYETIAQHCYHALIPADQRQAWDDAKIGDSEFSGGKWFEWYQPGQYHLVIMLFSHPAFAAQIVPKLMVDEMRLFEYRHKFTWAYAQSRELKKRLKMEAVEIQTCQEQFQKGQESAELLKTANAVLSRYLSSLSNLEIQGHTIETNLYNYQTRLTKLPEKLVGFNFPPVFKQEVEEKYLRQIRQDHASFAAWLKLIENVVASIQARELHHNVQQIAAVQSKVEWLEVFFASYYAAALVHYISGDFGFSKAYGAWSLVGWAVGAFLLTLMGLRPWRHSEEEKTSHYKWWVLGGMIVAAVVWFWIGYDCFRAEVVNVTH